MFKTKERGSMMVFIAFMMLVFIVLLALIIDIGFRYAERQNLVNLCDAAALAGVSDLPDSKPQAIGDAIKYALYNNYNGEINIGGFLDTSIATPPLSQYTEAQLKTFLIQSLNQPAGSYGLYYDNFISIPLENFTQAEWTSSLVGDLVNTYTDPDSVTSMYNPSKHFTLTLVPGCPTPEILSQGADPERAFFVGAIEKSVNLFASSFYDYYSSLGAHAVAYNNINYENDMENYSDSINLQAHLHGTPVIANGRLYQGTATTSGGLMFCLDPETLMPYWYFDTKDGTLVTYDIVTGEVLSTTNYATYGHGAGSHGIQTTIAYDNDYIYFQSTNGYMYALNAQNGQPVWQTQLSSGQESNVWVNSSPAVCDDYIITGQVDGTVQSLNKATGAVVSTYTTGNAVISSPTVVENNTVYIGSNDGKLYSLAVDQNNGTLTQNWSYTTGGSVRANPTYYNGSVYFGSDDNKFYKLDGTTGAQTWEYNTGLNPSYPNFRNGAAIEERYNASTLSLDKYVHVGDSYGKIYCIQDNGSSNTLSWSVQPPAVKDGYPVCSRVESTPTIINNVVYYVTRNEGGGIKSGAVYAYDTTNGSLLDSYWLANDSHATLITQEGYVYFGGCDNLLHKQTDLQNLSFLCDWYLIQ
ncbi:MAG: PQQ-binding-like beta-propeller repeat protein [Candidatus Hydrogenedentota bacterium]